MKKSWELGKHFLSIGLLSAGLALAPNALGAISNIGVTGNFAYSIDGNTADIRVDRIDNTTTNIATFGSYISNDLYLELWAFPSPYTGIGQVGYQQTGHKLASYRLGQLAVGYYFANVDTGPIPLTPPPAGTWYITAFVTQQTQQAVAGSNGLPGGAGGDGLLPQAYRNFPPVTFGNVVVEDSLPKSGLWWDATQIGTGYSIDVKHGVAVVVMFSYQADGTPQWYLSSGPLTNDGRTFTATLDKYAGGQCTTCTSVKAPKAAGDDGSITIEFASSTSAIVHLPGGRTSHIVPADF